MGISSEVSRIRLVWEYGLSNTTWFERLCACKAQRAALLAKAGSFFGRSRLTPVTLVPGIRVPRIPDSRDPGYCTFGVSLLL